MKKEYTVEDVMFIEREQSNMDGVHRYLDKYDFTKEQVDNAEKNAYATFNKYKVTDNEICKLFDLAKSNCAASVGSKLCKKINNKYKLSDYGMRETTKAINDWLFMYFIRKENQLNNEKGTIK